MTFYPGQAVICVNKNGWMDFITHRPNDEVPFRSEWIVADVYPNHCGGEDHIALVGDEPGATRVAKAFRVKEPNIEALRALLTTAMCEKADILEFISRRIELRERLENEHATDLQRVRGLPDLADLRRGLEILRRELARLPLRNLAIK